MQGFILKNVEKKIEKIFTLGTFKFFLQKKFTPFLLEAVEDRDVTFNQIQGS